MSGVVLRVMILGLVRDRGALALTFLVPAVFFLVFASVFSAASGGELVPRVALHAGGASGHAAFVDALAEGGGVTVVEAASLDEVREEVRRGRVDVGLGIDGAPDGGPPSFTIVTDPSRDAAAEILSARLQRAFAVTYLLPALGVSILDLGPEVVMQTVAGGPSGSNEVAYSAGAVALLFLLLSAVHGALTLFDEREGGVLERIVVGSGGIRPLVDGKFLFITVVGIAQVALIFGLAWGVHGVDPLERPIALALTSVLAAAAAAGIALALTTQFRTRQQAANTANVTMLILSALGGSMIPRFLMPEWLRAAGWFTPNAWALDAYTAILWRGGSTGELILPWTLLALAALAGLLVARVSARRMEPTV